MADFSFLCKLFPNPGIYFTRLSRNFFAKSAAALISSASGLPLWRPLNSPRQWNSFSSTGIPTLSAWVLTFFLVEFSIAAEPKLTILPILLLSSVVIIGLELGYILAYRNGWAMKSASVTANITLAVALIFVAMIFYKKKITAKQIAGIILCGGGLVLINI